MKRKSTFILLILSLFFLANPSPKEIDVSEKVTGENGGRPLLGDSVVIQLTTPCVRIKLTT